MKDLCLWASVILGLLVMASLYRAIGGPRFLNRMVAINVIGTKIVVILVLMGFIAQRIEMFVDIALAFALLNFIG
ncbi:MAG: monovalent cation/H+ antiporter complex subunit F, partial [Pseudomonadota bacterium]